MNEKSFSVQIRYFYIFLFLGVFLLCGGFYFVMAGKLVSSSENSMLEYGLQSVATNMTALLETANDNSKIVAYNDVVQQSLKKGEELEYEDRVQLQETVTRMAASCDGISSICLFDNNGEVYTAGNVYEVEKIRVYLEEGAFYQALVNESGTEEKESTVFTYSSYLDENQQLISFVRRVRDLDTLEQLGILVINIPADRVTETFRQIAAQYEMEVVLLDANHTVIGATENGTELASLMEEGAADAGTGTYRSVRLLGKKYKADEMDGEDGTWSVVGAIPRSRTLASFRLYTIFFVLCTFAGIGLCALGASMITQRINRPLQNILTSMGQVKAGKLERITVLRTNREMNDLQEQYNRMLDETEDLMEQKVEEQRLRRKYELSLLQAQIKPHFLYNTFDSVCALAMMGRTQDVYTMMQALGQYYRKSLHKGQEIIPVKEEIEIVENYLVIQSYRYDDVFQAVYDVDDSVLECRTLKLILQPLVENAIYHGFRENDLQGTITIRARDVGDYVMLAVEDDGIGMTAEKLEEVMSGTEKNQGKRFGLYGTIRRINLYYQQENRDLVEIESELGEGTRIRVYIPKVPKEKEEEGC